MGYLVQRVTSARLLQRMTESNVTGRISVTSTSYCIDPFDIWPQLLPSHYCQDAAAGIVVLLRC